jgi:anti-anti-sigma regulatory factor/CHASE3 domain sensor protein
MTSEPSTPTSNTPVSHTPPRPTRKVFTGNFKIGAKLTIGFGMMVVLSLLLVGLSHFASKTAIQTIDRTGDLRVPLTLEAVKARNDLLMMFGDVRSYLAFGLPEFSENYQNSEQSFQRDLEILEQLSPAFDEADQRRLTELQTAFEQWRELPPQLFEMRDDPMKREPAYAWLNTTGSEYVSAIRTNINQMIQVQAAREPSLTNNVLLKDMADFQNSFTTMYSGLRGYVTTRNDAYRYYEYETNITINESAWQNLKSKRNQLTTEQQVMLDAIETNRENFLDELPTEVFDVMESNQWRQDLFLFQTEFAPLTNQMQQLLQAMTENQQAAMLRDLNQGREQLDNARWQTIMGGGIVALLGMGLAFIFWRIIAGPIHRLTTVAERIRGGDFEAKAPVESRDEIGSFAATFNAMTTNMREAMDEIRSEKQRAADLQAEVIRSQESLLSELSTPLFPLANNVVTMPLIGSLDSTRAEQMMHTLLQGIEQHKARIAILDITGVPVVDTQVASALVRTAQAVRLLGTRVILTGIRPEVAQALVSIGANLESITTHSTLQDGIAYALELSGNEPQ